eukprot:TRINITY_DN244_c0_g1_i1.p1 TRINITY_DN244_c0_g1~~TRINITY_DN244_c0_g1_i1.p1  ORF type:complete len:494 (+),score=134.87 TRINITY_DN244_c0_g1_i1:240-1721(+)
MYKYKLISKKGEGTFSEVLKAQAIKTGKYVAIKCMKNHFDSIDQVNNLREIQALRRLVGHPNIIRLHEVLYDEPTGRLALVFELMDMNLYEAIKGRRHYLPEQKVKHYLYETLKAIDHMHRNGIFHRDVKPENLLLEDDVVKLADLGSCRGIYSRQPFTEYISTRWYRAPECLLTDGYYNFKMDLFAVGCVAFEIIALYPLFPGQDEMDQIQKIHNILGTPSAELLACKFKRNASHMDFNFPEKKGTAFERLIPHASPELTEVVRRLTKYDPDERILARQALKEPYFRELRDAEKEAASPAVAAVAPASMPAPAAAPPQPPPGNAASYAMREAAARQSEPLLMGAKAAASSSAAVLSSNAVASVSQLAASASAAAIVDHGHGGDPETTHEPVDEDRAVLPTIPHRGAPLRVGGAAVDAPEGTVLPPIGGFKAKRAAANGMGGMTKIASTTSTSSKQRETGGFKGSTGSKLTRQLNRSAAEPKLHQDRSQPDMS